MVVIEPEFDDEESKLPAPNTATPDCNVPSTPSPLESRDSAVIEQESDGFETASERYESEEDEKADANENEVRQLGTQNSNSDQHASEGSFEETSKDVELARHNLLEEATNAKLEGNKLFGEGKYDEALLKYDASLTLAKDLDSPGELLAVCHSNRGVCFLKLGRYEETVKECSKALELNPSYVKALMRRAEAREKLDNFEEAIADMKKILELEPSNEQAIKCIRRLEPLAAEKREKMKEEMIGKLKDMGNSILGRFGMSLDNFKTVQDPNTGSYSISFQK